MSHLRKLVSHRARGFTLIEVMITVAIVAILSAIAYPSYRDYILRGQLVDGTNGLSALRVAMERYYQDNRTYASTGSFVTPCAASTGRTFGNFTVSCAGADAPTDTSFVLRAVGSGNVAGFEYTVNQLGQQATTAVPSGSGWSSCATAWIVKKGQTCS